MNKYFDKSLKNRIIILSIIFVISISFRVIILYAFLDNYKHNCALFYGSSAIGLYKHGTFTVTENEMKLLTSSENLRGNYLDFENINETRSPQTTYLPAPGYIIYVLWKIFPIYNFTTFIFLQIILESAVILLMFLFFYKYCRKISWVILIFLMFNIVAIKRTLMVSYDFWPEIIFLLSFYFIYKILEKNRIRDYIYLAIVNSVAIWFREISIFLVITACIFVIFLNIKNKALLKSNLVKISLLLVLFFINLGLLSYYRENVTGNSRPTRSTLWHSYMVGIGQFNNPYNVTPIDTSAMNFALRNDPNLKGKGQNDTWQMLNEPNSEYETYLREKSIEFIKNYPHLFVRNTIYRTAIILSPLLYSDGDFLPEKYQKIFFVFGLIFLPVWFLGIYRIYKYNKILFYTIIILFANTIISFSWWYVVGRVIIPILFAHFIVYLFALKYFYDKFFKDKLEVYFKRNNKKLLVTDNTQNL